MDDVQQRASGVPVIDAVWCAALTLHVVMMAVVVMLGPQERRMEHRSEICWPRKLDGWNDGAWR